MIDQVLTLLARIVEERTGLHHSERDRDLLASKVVAFAEDQGFPTVLDFYYALRYDDPDGQRFSALIDAIVVGETYFFRERDGLTRAVEHVAARAANGERSRVWSAACATGEEPLSMAALLAERGLLGRVELGARRALPPRAARRPGRLPPWIAPEGGSVWVHPALRDAVSWPQVNLLDRDAVATLGRFDVILCRNVLIYFAEPTIDALVRTLANALAPGGVLIVGAAESLLRFGATLECVERGGSFLYRRRAAP
jgi:chemotaxis protein methyltransferase CheR